VRRPENDPVWGPILAEWREKVRAIAGQQRYPSAPLKIVPRLRTSLPPVPGEKRRGKERR
jgi:hypothetical protein